MNATFEPPPETMRRPMTSVARRRAFQRNKAEFTRARVQRIIDATAARRHVDGHALTGQNFGCHETAAARVLALAVCCAAGVPAVTVAGIFGVTWHAVDSARSSAVERCRDDQAACDEFMAILRAGLAP